jgi:undecaprenyl diphosphate synthase
MTSHVTPEVVRAHRDALGVPDERMPRSVAIIMDGNGRWALSRGLPRSAGHEAGGRTVRKIITGSACLGLDVLSLYSFSIENWRRPKDEINTLMHLYAEYLVEERPTLMEHNIRLRHIGRRDGLPDTVLRELDLSLDATHNNTGMTLCLALNYASRAEIADAVTRIARKVALGQMDPVEIDEAVIAGALDTAGLQDPDLLIRTSGEMRLSNFLLWQMSYAEWYVTDVHWPEFDEAEFYKALRAYGSRHRRFGGVDESNR